MQPKTLLRYSALALLLVFSSACSHSAKSYMQSAKKYFDSGKYDDAIILYKKAIQKEPKSGEAYYRLALRGSEIRQDSGRLSGPLGCIQLLRG